MGTTIQRQLVSHSRRDITVQRLITSLLHSIGLARTYGQVRAEARHQTLKEEEVNIKTMNRDYPLAPTYFGDKDVKFKRMAALKENLKIKAAEKAQKKIEKSTGLEYEPPVRKRDMKPLKNK